MAAASVAGTTTAAGGGTPKPVYVRLATPEFADFWALKWADILRTEEKVLDTEGVEAFHGWIRESVASASPWMYCVSMSTRR